MTEVHHTLTDGAGRPLQRQTVRFSLVAPGNPFTEISEGSAVIQARAVDTDVDGTFSVDLIPTSQYEYEGAVYRVDARDGIDNDDAIWYITVPDTGSHDLRDLLTDAPAAAAPVSDAPRFLLFTTSWPPRGTSPRATFYIGGNNPDDQPVDVNLQAGDLWFPATA